MNYAASLCTSEFHSAHCQEQSEKNDFNLKWTLCSLSYNGKHSDEINLITEKKKRWTNTHFMKTYALVHKWIVSFNFRLNWQSWLSSFCPYELGNFHSIPLSVDVNIWIGDAIVTSNADTTRWDICQLFNSKTIRNQFGTSLSGTLFFESVIAIIVFYKFMHVYNFYQRAAICYVSSCVIDIASYFTIMSTRLARCLLVQNAKQTIWWCGFSKVQSNKIILSNQAGDSRRSMTFIIGIYVNFDRLRDWIGRSCHILSWLYGYLLVITIRSGPECFN